jgi:hypothetical protein
MTLGSRKQARRSTRLVRLVVGVALSVAGRSHGQTPAAWLAPADGTWTDPSKWSSTPAYPRNGSPTSADLYDVTIGAAGSPYTVTLDATAAPGATIAVDRLSLTSAEATAVASAGTFTAGLLNLDAGTFRLAGGTLKDTVVPAGGGGGGALVGLRGTLDHVTLGRAFEASRSGRDQPTINLTVRNGLVFQPGGSFRLTWMDDSPFFNTVVFDGPQAIAGSGTMTFDGNALTYCRVANGALTIGDGVTVRGATSIQYGDDDVVNFGTVRGDSVSQPFILENSGRGPLGRFVNRGVLAAGPGGSVLLRGRFDGTDGTIRAEGGRVQVGQLTSGSFAYTTAMLGRLEATAGGVIAVSGKVDNTGASLSVPAGGTIELMAGLTGGRLDGTAGGGFVVRRNAAIDNVILAGRLEMGPQPGDAGDVYASTRGLTLDGGTITLRTGPAYGSSPPRLQVVGPATIDGTGQIVFAGASDLGVLNPTGGGTLTVGPGVTIRTDSAGGGVGNGGAATVVHGAILSETGHPLTLYGVDNRGVIRASNAGSVVAFGLTNRGAVTISGGGGLTLASGWDNPTGTIAVDHGAVTFSAAPATTAGAFTVADSTVTVNGPASLKGIAIARSTITVAQYGELDNAGQALSLAGGNQLRLDKGRVNGGRIAGGGGPGEEVVVPNPDPVYGGSHAQADGVTLAVPLRIESRGTLEVFNGLRLDAARVTLEASHVNPETSLVMTGNGQITGAGEVVFEGTSSRNWVNSASPLILGEGIALRTGTGGGRVTSPTVVNRGRIEARTASRSIAVQTSTFSNVGVVDVGGGGSVRFSDVDGGWSGVHTFEPGSRVRVGLTTAVGAAPPISGVGSLRLDGTLEIDDGGGSFVAVAMRSYAVLTARVLNGSFSAYQGLDLPGSLALAPVYSTTDLRLVATLPGDANVDGRVNFDDLLAVARHYNQTVSAATANWWAGGDFTYDGVVNFDDLLALAKNYNGDLAGATVAGATAAFTDAEAAAFADRVPEPRAGLLTAAAAASGLALRRRSRRPRLDRDAAWPVAAAAKSKGLNGPTLPVSARATVTRPAAAKALGRPARQFRESPPAGA